MTLWLYSSRSRPSSSRKDWMCREDIPWLSGVTLGKGWEMFPGGIGGFSASAGRKGSVGVRTSSMRVSSWKVRLAVVRFIAGSSLAAAL